MCKEGRAGSDMTVSLGEGVSVRRQTANRKRHGLASKRRCPRTMSAIERKLALLDIHLELKDLTNQQPAQVLVRCEDGTERVIMLTTPSARRKRREQERMSPRVTHGAHKVLETDKLEKPSDFSVSKRYRCKADPRGQVQGGVGFVYHGIDVATNAEVAVKLFHKTEDPAALMRYHEELVSGLKIHRALHDNCQLGDMDDLNHIIRLRDIILDAPMYSVEKPLMRGGNVECFTTAMVFDWADGGDAHALVAEYGSLTSAEGMGIFRQMAKGLRALHRRGIVHRDVKPENVILDSAGTEAKLCDLGFAKHCSLVCAADLVDDPTTCYQAPERWLASSHICATVARGAWDCPQIDEPDGELLLAGDAFSSGVSLFILLAYDALVMRMQHAPSCKSSTRNNSRPEEAPVPPRNIFQCSRGHGVFELLDAGVPPGGSQRRLWNYWAMFGVCLNPNVEGLLDGLLHPLPEMRWGMDQAFSWMEAHPEMFEEEVRQ
ncbi:unnamed protein product [Choristocarpus tenellus]